MKTLKRTLALIAALTVVATTMAGCSDDETKTSGSTTTPATTAGGGTTPDPGTASAKPADDKVTLKTGGENFTIVTWNDSDFPALLNLYAGNTAGVAADAPTAVAELDKNPKTPNGTKINFVNKGVNSGDISAVYNQMLNDGNDIDVYAAEADFILSIINDDAKAADMSTLGFTADSWVNDYPYTAQIGTNEAGKLKAQSWQVAVGGYAYRADLAKEYLGVDTPEAMQTLIGDWDKFTAAAKTLREKSANAKNGAMAMAATIGGIWQVYAPNRDQAWVDSSNTIIVDDKAKAFISMVKDYRANEYVTDVGQWSTAWFQIGQKEKALGYFISTWGMGDTILIAAAGGVSGVVVKDPAKDADPNLVEGGVKSVGQWKVCQGPQAFFWGGTWMIVNPKTDNGIEAKDFIYTTTIDDVKMGEYALGKGEFVNNSVAMQKVIETVDADPTKGGATVDCLGGQNYYKYFSEAAKNITLDSTKITKYDSVLKGEFLNEVTAYANGTEASYTDVDTTVKGFLKKAVEKTGLNAAS
jgi:hypothetical protein